MRRLSPHLAGFVLSWALSIGALAGLGSATTPPLPKQDLSKEVLPEHRDALRRIALYDRGPQRAQQLLESVGFRPTDMDGGLPIEKWRAMPAIRKLEYAYLSAEAAEPLAGGGRFLALLSRRLAQDYPAITEEASVRPLLGAGQFGEQRLSFSSPRRALPAPDLPENVSSALRTLAGYAEGSPWGGARHILQHSFGLSTNATWEINRSSATTEEMLTKGLSQVAPEQRDAVLRRAIGDVAHRYPNAVREVTFAKWLGPGNPIEGPRATSLRSALESDYRDLRAELLLSTRGPEGATAGKSLAEVREALDGSAEDLAEASRKIERAREAITSASESRAGVDRAWLSGRGGEPPPTPDTGSGRPGPKTPPPPNRFDDLFPRGPESSKVKTLTRDLWRAPGGVIVEYRPSGRAPPISGVRFSGASRRAEVLVQDRWVRTDPPLEADVLRVAYAFTVDRRAVGVDLRPPNVAELDWLIRNHPKLVELELQSKGERRRARNVLQGITSVNMHPALLDTSIGEAFIHADELIFDLLPTDVEVTEAQLIRNGVDLKPLRVAYRKDADAARVNPASATALHYKSILAATSGSWELGERLILETDFAFDIYWIPIHFEHSSEWFESNAPTLVQAFPELAAVREFAAATALCNLVIEAGVEHDLRPLLETPPSEGTTHRFLQPERYRWEQK